MRSTEALNRRGRKRRGVLAQGHHGPQFAEPVHELVQGPVHGLAGGLGGGGGEGDDPFEFPHPLQGGLGIAAARQGGEGLAVELEALVGVQAAVVEPLQPALRGLDLVHEPAAVRFEVRDLAVQGSDGVFVGPTLLVDAADLGDDRLRQRVDPGGSRLAGGHGGDGRGGVGEGGLRLLGRLTPAHQFIAVAGEQCRQPLRRRGLGPFAEGRVHELAEPLQFILGVGPGQGPGPGDPLLAAEVRDQRIQPLVHLAVALTPESAEGGQEIRDQFRSRVAAGALRQPPVDVIRWLAEPGQFVLALVRTEAFEEHQPQLTGQPGQLRIRRAGQGPGGDHRIGGIDAPGLGGLGDSGGQGIESGVQRHHAPRLLVVGASLQAQDRGLPLGHGPQGRGRWAGGKAVATGPGMRPCGTMRTLVIDMPSGIAGDMLLAALVDAGADLDRIATGLDGLGVGPIPVLRSRVQAGSLAATRLDVSAPQEAAWAPLAGGHAHRPYREIRDRLSAAALPPRVRDRAQAVFRALAEAEGAVHGVAADEVGFHEVGSLDAIADVVGCCLALEDLAIDMVAGGTVQPGRGTVRCAHGLMPVPVPAVARMLATSGWPMRLPDRDTGELTTPTGMALLLGLGAPAAQPAGRIVATGLGAGHKAIPGLVNAVRVLVVESAAPATGDEVVELRTQLDDATGEQLGAALDRLLAAGARDAYLTPILMKKGRPGSLLTVLAAPADADRLTDLILTATPAIGVRRSLHTRRILPREAVTVSVRGMAVALKAVVRPDGRRTAKPEADAVRAAADALGLPADQIAAEALAAWKAGG